MPDMLEIGHMARIHNAIQTVAFGLGELGGGGYRYEEDRFWVACGSRGWRFQAGIIPPGDSDPWGDLVYYAYDLTKVDIYRPGRWEAYLLNVLLRTRC